MTTIALGTDESGCYARGIDSGRKVYYNHRDPEGRIKAIREVQQQEFIYNIISGVIEDNKKHENE